MLSHPLRIVIATKGMTRYPTGGGHWSWLLQYLLGLRDLGHDVHLLEFMAPTGDAEFDARVPRIFRRRLAAAGAEGLGVLLRGVGWEAEDEALEATRPVGHSQAQVAELIRGADCLWNLCGALIGPLRDAFSHRVFIDVDPGVTQLSALEHDMGLVNHDAFFTTGGKLGDAGCDVPDAGRRWHRFLPFVHLPSWPMAPAPQ